MAKKAPASSVLPRGLLPAIARLAKKPAPRHRLALPEQPFDSELLRVSPLYRRSRELYLAEGGTFRAALVSSPRTLSSTILLEPRIEYSPIATELEWAVTDPRERRDPRHFLQIRAFASSLYHEQNHRVLWRRLPPPPRDPGALRRYLNFAEALVVASDMALGDELAPRLAPVFYGVGVTYDPGTGARSRARSRREYRNYLQAALHATYLNLELYDPERIPDAIHALFPLLGEQAELACQRALRLDRAFVERTNPVWQRRNRAAIAKALFRPSPPPLELSPDPMDNRVQYLAAEGWFTALGI